MAKSYDTDLRSAIGGFTGLARHRPSDHPSDSQRAGNAFARNFTFVSAEDEEAGRKIKKHCMREYRRAQRWHRAHDTPAPKPDHANSTATFTAASAEWPLRCSPCDLDGSQSSRRSSHGSEAPSDESFDVAALEPTAQTDTTVAIPKSQDSRCGTSWPIVPQQSQTVGTVTSQATGPPDASQVLTIDPSLLRTTLDRSDPDPMSSFPIPLFEGDRPLVNHLYKYYLPLIFSNSTDITYRCFPPFNSLYFMSAPYFHTMLAQSSCQAAVLKGEPIPTQLSTYHMWKAIQLTNQGLRDPERQRSDEVLLGVLGLIKFEAQYGNKRALAGHFDGLNKIFAKRDVNEVYQNERPIDPLQQMLSWIMAGTSSADGTFPVARIDAAAKARIEQECDFLLSTLNQVWIGRPQNPQSSPPLLMANKDIPSVPVKSMHPCDGVGMLPPTGPLLTPPPSPDLKPVNLQSRYVTQISSLLFMAIAQQEYAAYNPFWKYFTDVPAHSGQSIDELLWGAARGHLDLPEFSVAMMRRMPSMIRCLRAVGQLQLKTRFRVREYLLWALLGLGAEWTEADYAGLRMEVLQRARRP